MSAFEAAATRYLEAMRHRIAWGVALVVLGTLLLLRELDVLPDISLWSALVLAAGLWLLGGALAGRHRAWIWTLGVVAAGVLLILRDLDVLPEDFSVWPVAVIVIGLGIVFDAFPRRRDQAERTDQPTWWEGSGQ